MVPRKFNIVDFDGFDLAGQYGEALPGIYDKIVDAHWNCVYIMCFGLKFAGFDIAPQYMTPDMLSDHIMLNGIISIDQNDVITIPSIGPAPPAPIIIPGVFGENGTFNPPSGVDGFSPVTVNVSGGEGDYELLEYIQSDGTQVIDTGLIIPANSQLYVDYSPLSSQDFRWAFGAEYSGNSSFAGVVLIPASGKLRIYKGDSQYVEYANISYDGSGNYSPTIMTVNADSVSNLLFFGLGRAQDTNYRMSNLIFKKAKLNNRFYLPARRKSDGICGLWDNVANQLLTDSLNGNPFLAGPVLLSF